MAWVLLLAVALGGLFPLGMIELLFLLAPLVILPLGLALAAAPGRLSGSPLPHRAASLLQPFAAAFAAASLFVPVGIPAAIVGAPWFLLTALVGLAGLVRLKHVRKGNFADLLITAGMLLLPVGGVGLLATRSGTAALGFPEPIILLTAVHFHFTAFAGPLLTASAGRVAGRGRVLGPLYVAAGLGMVLGTPLLALGFVFSPTLKLSAVLALVIAFWGTAVLELRALPLVRRRSSRILLGISAGAVVAGMALVAVFEVGSFTRTAWISIPQMAWTHGLLNGLGFALCGVWAWRLEFGEPTS